MVEMQGKPEGVDKVSPVLTTISHYLSILLGVFHYDACRTVLHPTRKSTVQMSWTNKRV